MKKQNGQKVAVAMQVIQFLMAKEKLSAVETATYELAHGEVQKVLRSK